MHPLITDIAIERHYQICTCKSYIDPYPTLNYAEAYHQRAIKMFWHLILKCSNIVHFISVIA